MKKQLSIQVAGIGFSKDLSVAGGEYATIVEALRANDINIDGYKLFVNGVEFESGDILEAGDVVQVIKNEKNA